MSVLESIAEPFSDVMILTPPKRRRCLPNGGLLADPLHGGALASLNGEANLAETSHPPTPLSSLVSVKQEPNKMASATSSGNGVAKRDIFVKLEPVEPSLSSLAAAIDEKPEVKVKREHLVKIESDIKRELVALEFMPCVVDNTATLSGATVATPHTPTRSDSLRQRKPSSHVGGRDALRARLAQQRTVLAGSPTLANSPPSDDIDMTDAPSHSARVEPANATLSSTMPGAVPEPGPSSSHATLSTFSVRNFGYVKLMDWVIHELDETTFTRMPYPLERAKAKFDPSVAIIAAATERFVAPRIQKLPSLDVSKSNLKRKSSKTMPPGERSPKRLRDGAASIPVSNDTNDGEDVDMNTGAAMEDIEMLQTDGDGVELLGVDIRTDAEEERLRTYKERVQRRRSKTPIPGSARPVERPLPPRQAPVSLPKELAVCAICSESSIIEKNPRLAQSRSARRSVTSKEPLAGMRMPCPLQHTFCVPCITKHIRRQLQPDNSADVLVFPIRCPNCPANIWADGIPDAVVNLLLFPNDLQLWNKRRATQPTKPLYCVNSECKKPVKAGPGMGGPCGKCPACGTEVCISCQISFREGHHFGLSCIEYVAKYPRVQQEQHKRMPIPPPGTAILELKKPTYGLPEPSERGHIPRLGREDGIKPGVVEHTRGRRRRRQPVADEESDPEEEKYDDEDEDDEEPWEYPDIDHELTWMDDFSVVSRKHEFTTCMFEEEADEGTGRMCQYCEAQYFHSIEALRRHLLHCQHAVFACCGRFFATEAGLNSHRSSTPNRFGKHICATKRRKRTALQALALLRNILADFEDHYY